jgi:hypothetical protein
MTDASRPGGLHGTRIKALTSDLQARFAVLDELITELRVHHAEWARSGRIAELVTQLSAQPHLVELPAVLLCVHEEIAEVLDGIRRTRSTLESHAVERLRDTQHRLSDVTATTEHATLELLNGLDRSLELIDSLERGAHLAAQAGGFQALRQEVSALYHHLQFQDIATQQLQGVTHQLRDLEARVGTVASLFDRILGAVEGGTVQSRIPVAPPPGPLAYDPHATMQRGSADQALIDQTFEGARHGQPADSAGRSAS